ncbi:sensor histidine kinase [Paeniclostridium hominis]|uniref:sensor histidine kinase n=1 Tax=Paeniclostridium hominis TaxID=2764329 RepID=UPI0022E7F808|nr:HAMP domain-containing sensor histidine kinase [Paeniclostridium hominis]
MNKLKLFSKTYIFTMGIISLIILISSALIYLALPKVYMNNKQKEADKIIKALIEQVSKSDNEESFKIAKNFAEKYNIQVLLTIGDEKKVFQGLDKVDIYVNEEEVTENYLIIPNLSGENREVIGDDGFGQYININNLSIIKSRDFKKGNDVNGSAKIVMDLESFTETRDVILKILPYSIFISLLIALIASYIYARKITTPIKEICDVTKKMENLNKEAFCKVETEDEIGILAANINSLYYNLLNTIVSLEEEIKNVSESEKIKVDFLRSASHELKTPLMSMNIMIENMLYDIGKYKNHYIYLEKCKDIVSELSKMVQEILDTSKLNIINNKDESLLDLGSLVQKNIEPYKLIAKSKKINIKVNFKESFNIKVDEKLFTKVISNIISNAVNYTDEGKEIRIYIKDKKLIMENDCKPIADEHLVHIFEAFYRVDFDRNKSSGGNGLGLYIVEQILKMYNLDYSFKSILTGMSFEVNFNNEIVIES